MDSKTLEEIIVGPGHLDKEIFTSVKKEAEDQKIPLEELLVEKELIRDEQLGRLMAESLGFPFVELRKESVDQELLSLIPELVARSKGVIAYGRKDDSVKVGMVNPKDIETRHMIEKRVGGSILPYYITRQDLDAALIRYSSSLRQVFDKPCDLFFRDPAFGLNSAARTAKYSGRPSSSSLCCQRPI